MTVPGTDVLVTYTGDGVATDFPYGFEIPDADSAVIQLEEIATEIYTTLTPAQYTITGLGDVGGGTVTYNPGTPLAATHKIHIMRDTEKTQLVTVSNQAAYFPMVSEGVWDRLTMFTQELADKLTRVHKLGVGKTAGSITVGAENTVLAWDAVGNIISSIVTLDDLEAAAGLAAGAALTRETIADLIALATGPIYPGLPENTVVFVNGRGYVKSTGATDLPTIPGFVPYGNTAGLAQFGAKGDCVVVDGVLSSGTDDSSFFQAAVDWQQAVPGRSLEGDIGAKYLLTTTIVGSGKPFTIDWRGATWFKNSSGSAFQFQADTEYYDLTGDYTAGDLALAVQDTGTALRPGRPFVILSDGISRVNRDQGSSANQYRVGEWATAGIGTTTTNIVLNRPLMHTVAIDPNDPNLAVALVDEARVDSFTTTLNARITVSDFPEINWVGGEGEYAEGHGAGSGSIWQGVSLQVIGYTGVIRDFRVNRGYDAAIASVGNYNLRIEHCYAKRLENNTADGQFGYAVTDSSFGTTVVDCLWLDCRHGFTTGSPTQAADEKSPDTLGVPGSVNAIVDGCRATDFRGVAPMDTHHGSWNTTFVNCYVDNCTAEYAFALRGRGHRIINPTVRNCVKGFYCFTEFDSGDPNDDLYTAGKEARDRTSMTIHGGDIELTDVLFNMQYSDLSLEGWMKVRSTSHVICTGEGEVSIYGNLNFAVETFEGALSLTAANNFGVLQLEDADHANKGNLLDKTIFKIHAGATLYVDATAATSTGLSFVNAEASSEFINEGKVTVLLPGGADLFSSVGDISGSGHLEFSLAGEPDNTQTPELIGREINIDSTDETVRWLAELPGKSLQPLVTDIVPLDIVGTGSEIPNAYIPPLRLVVQHMATQSGGQISMKQAFQKTGSSGTATIKYDAYGNFQDSIVMAADDDSLMLTHRLVVVDNENTTNTFQWEAYENTGETFTPRNRLVLDNYVAPDLITKSGNPLDLDPTIAVGDTITLHYTEIKVTSGGYY